MKFLFILFVFIISETVFSQEIRISQNELNRISVDKFIVKASQEKNGDSINFFYNKALLISEEIDYWDGEVKACKGLFKIHEKDVDIYEKLRFALLLSNLYDKKGSLEQKVIGCNQLAKIYYNERLYSKAIEQYKKSVVLEGEGNSGTFESQIGLVKSYKGAKEFDEALVSARKLESKSTLTNQQKIELQKEKAEVYHVLNAYKEELESYQIIISLLKNSNDSYLEPTIWNNIGYTQKYLNDFSSAKIAFSNAIEKADSKDFQLIGGGYYNLGLIHYNQHDLDSAFLCFELGKKAYESLNSYENIYKSMNMQAMVYYKKNDQYNAFILLKNAITLEKENKIYSELARSYEIKSMVHQDLFEYELALIEYKNFLNIRDSLLTENRFVENKLLFEQYKIEQIEKQFRLIWAKSEMNVINTAKERAEKEAEKERFNSKIKEDQLNISELKNSELKAKQELQRLQLNEEQLNRESAERKLELSKRENELKKLALEKEFLVIEANKKEIGFLAKQSDMETQKRKRDAADHAFKMRIVYGVLLLILIILIIIIYSYKQLHKRKVFIEKQNAIIEESRALIEKEKEISESLLLNILPESIADELKLNGSSKPKLFNEVSIGFTDFSGFTMISEKMSPQQLVEKLDEIFYEFDLIIEKNGLQRIKTIGDAYMFAGGVPEHIENHAVQTVNAALDLRNFIDEYNSKLTAEEPKWNIRIGVNTGQIVAGVIGIKKFAYDIWGDAVNIAARMESSGEIGKVNVSGSTFELVKDNFKTEYRGKIKAKNKGEIDMYFIEK